MVRAKITRLVRFLMLACGSAVAGLALGHQPHDPIDYLLISPEFAIDGSVFTAQLRADSWGHALPVGSSDRGLTWSPLPNGMTNLSTFKTACMSPSFATDGTLFYFSGQQGLYRTHDRGLTWQQVGLDTLNSPVTLSAAAAVPDGRLILYAACDAGGLFASDDLGNTWTQLVAEDTIITALAVSPDFRSDRSVIIGDADGRVHTSSDAGRTWTSLGRIATSNGINEITIAPNFETDGEFFIATDASGLLHTIDHGETFARIDSGLPNDVFTAVTLSPNYQNDNMVFTMTRGSAVYISTDQGRTWTHHDVGVDLSDQTKRHYRVLKVSPNYAIDGTLFVGAFEGLYRSTDRGQSWHHMPTRPPLLITGISTSPDFATDRAVAISTYGSGLYVLRSQGASWDSANVGIENPFCYGITFAPRYGGGRDLLAIHREKLLVSQDDGQSWDIQAVSFPGGLQSSHHIDALIHSERVFPTVMRASATYAQDGLVFIGTRHHGLRISDQIRGTWLPARLGLLHIASIAPSPAYRTDSTIFVATNDGEILRSVDASLTWEQIGSGLPSGLGLVKLDASPNFTIDGMVLAGTSRGLYVTQDGGDSWHTAGSNVVVTTQPTEAVAFSPNYGSGRGGMLASVRGHGLYRFLERTAVWEQVAPELIANGYQITRIAYSPDFEQDGTIYAAAGTHILLSTDNGKNWQLADMGFLRVEDYESRTINLFGDWSTIESPDASAGSFAVGSSSQCAIHMVFSGTGVSWLGRLDPTLGTADVYVDGQYYTSVDQYNSLSVPLYPVLSITDLPYGEHELMIIESSNSGDGGLALDAFDVYTQ
ncbi:MAG: hypothetical protein D8M59_03530 [Planctomycetes bacterium]|nr:hypothetical protein [Planctomycetota bacterium]NOG53069.1 hypothetical protein [Planctomycetota bacterium]